MNNSKLDMISSEIFNKESLNLSFYDKDVVNSVLALRIIEDVDFSTKTLEKYRYFDHFFILKINDDYYFINTNYIDVYYITLSPLKINDYNIYQRKDKLKQIQNNIDYLKN